MAENHPQDEPKKKNQRHAEASQISAATQQIGLAVRDLSNQFAHLVEQIKADNQTAERERKDYEKEQLFWINRATKANIVLSTITVLVLIAAVFVADQQRRITSGQLVVMRDQLNEMKGTAEDTHVIAQATAAQSLNTERMLGHNIKASRLDQRAWVGPTVITASRVTPRTEAIFTVTFKNTGRTPATQFKTITALSVGIPIKDFAPPRLKRIPQSTGVIQPGADVNVRRYYKFSDDDIDAIKQNAKHVHLFGVFEYRDIFNIKRTGEFCARLNVQLDRMNACEHGNRAD